MKVDLKKAVTTGTVVTGTQGNDVLARTVINNTYSICGKRIASVPVSLMELDHSYQRVLGTTVRKLLREWNNDKCDFLYVSYRDNKFYIIDGQHRYQVAKHLNITELPCIIFTGLTRCDEALMFAQQQDNVNRLSPYDTFKANITCGDSTIESVRIDMEIKRVCDKYAVEIKKYGNGMVGQKVFRCLGTAHQIVSKLNGVEKFELLMEIINSSNWAETSLAYSDKIIVALNAYLTDNVDMIETIRPKLIEVMNEKSPEELIAYGNCHFPNYAPRTATTLALNDLVNTKVLNNMGLMPAGSLLVKSGKMTATA